MNRWFKSQVHICLVGALVLSFGVSSLIGLLFAWMNGEGGLDLGFLLIFIGLGLLRGSVVQRSLFVGLLALGFVVLVIIFVVALAQGAFSSATLDWEAGVGFLMFCIYLYCFVVLWGARSDPWFAEKFSGKGPAFVIPVTVILTLLFSLSYEVKESTMESKMDEIYRYDFDVMVTDGRTGEFVGAVIVTHPPKNFERLKVPRFMETTRSSSPSDERAAANIQGYARGDVEAFVNKEGYHEVSIKVNRDTGSVVNVVIDPIDEK